MVSVFLPCDSLSQHLLSYLGFSYLGRGLSLHGCSSKVQPLLLTVVKGYLLTAAPPDLERGVALLGPPAPAQPPLLGHGVAPLSHASARSVVAGMLLLLLTRPQPLGEDGHTMTMYARYGD